MKLWFLLLAPAIFLVSCDVISEDQCRSGDWTGIGLSDGRKGRPASVLNEYADICGEFGIAPVRDAYLAAREQGLKSYCTPANAYEVGRDGNRLNKVCTPEQVAWMLPAYNRGQDYYELSRDIDDLEDDIDRLEARLAGFPDAPDSAQAQEIRAIHARIARLESRIFHLRLERRRYARWP